MNTEAKKEQGDSMMKDSKRNLKEWPVKKKGRSKERPKERTKDD